MACLNHTVEQLTTADSYTAFKGLDSLALLITLPDWHEPFPIQERIGAANPRQLEMHGLLHVCKSWYINGPVVDQWSISTMMGSIKVPAGTRIESTELPQQWQALSKESDAGKKEWFAYSNGRTAFC